MKDIKPQIKFKDKDSISNIFSFWNDWIKS